MGAKLQKLYEFASAKGGMQERMRIAMKCGFSSVKAMETPDTPENIEKLKSAIKEICGITPPAV
ncbi:hypothetical protein KKF34_01880 [Myxococcota bacterium]|nr:hypothetical protein [Myxococcota bacterium]MBU1382759.1 hypothetical protein [Myxococcota bacterium]MBU1495609.1 hypothetical protein [Myxococcota bacterium]